MNIQKSINVIIASAALTAVAVGASFAQGNLTPGGADISPAPTNLGGVLITSQTSQFTSIINPANYSGNFYAAVYQESSAANPLGGLTFVWQVSNNGGSNDKIDRFTEDGFTGFQTSAFYSTQAGGLGAGTIAPNSAFRPTATEVGFRTDNGAGAGTLLPGDTSDLFIVRTDAPTYKPGAVGILDGDISSAPAYLPSPPSTVPEPATLAPFALGGLGLLGLIVRKTRWTNGAAA